MAEPTETEVEHQPTADVVLTLTYLLEHGGWARSSELARVSGVHRDTARRILRQLTNAAWVEAREVEGETRYRVGPELPRIGLAFLELLQREQWEIRKRYDAATVQHDWVPGPGGRMAWTRDPGPADARPVLRRVSE
jgi:predicted transcriptional regulator